MISGIDSAVSGLHASEARIEGAAQNIANQDSTSVIQNGKTIQKPYTPQDIVQISQQGGGVTTLSQDAPDPTTKIYNPDSSQAAADGTVNVPNVDDATQMVNIKIASYDFKANLKTIKVQSDLEQSLLNIVS